MSKRKAKKVLLIGWDAADWKVINPLMDQGKMPTLSKFVSEGVMGNLATLDPPLSPMLWTTIATGKRADEHGIMGFIQSNASGDGVTPVLSTSRKVKALWNIFMQHGMKSNVVAWWPSHPAEPIDGIYVSNFYHKLSTKIDYRKPLAPATVHPEKYSKIMDELRVFPWELSQEHLLPFVPDAAKIDQEKDQRLASVAKILSETATVHAAATWAMENSEWDLMAVYYDGIDHFGHGFMNYHPPKMDIIKQEDFNLYKGVVEAGYRFHDMMLERLLELAGGDTTVIIVSDHGFHSDHLRPKGLEKAPAAPAAQHRPYGIFCAKGPGIRKDEIVYGSTLLDITPTILDLFGLPIGKDMPGKPILQIYERPEAPDYIDSWENEPGECGMHSEEKRHDPWAEKEAMEQMIALGYIDPPGEDKKEYVDNTVRESKYYLSKVYMDGRKYTDALPVLIDIFEEKQEARYARALIRCYLNLNKSDEAMEILERLEKIHPKAKTQMQIFRARISLQKKEYDLALEYLEKAYLVSPNSHVINLELGNTYFIKKHYTKSEQAYKRCIEINHIDPSSHYGLGRVYLKLRNNQLAAEHLVSAISLRYYFPVAHYFLGEALFRLKNHDRALEAYQIAVIQAPGMEKAHLRLIKLYGDIYKNEEKAEEHRRFIEEKILPLIKAKGRA
ncbi:MAG: alkaline phosphatase family protein [Candidatus Neomarinimicrobiota bacterium]